MQSAQQAIEQDVAGLAFEDPIEAGLQGPGAFGVRVDLVGLEVLVEPPDQRPGQVHRLAVLGVGGVSL
jgi:hypothetical protein